MQQLISVVVKTDFFHNRLLVDNQFSRKLIHSGCETCLCNTAGQCTQNVSGCLGVGGSGQGMGAGVEEDMKGVTWGE